MKTNYGTIEGLDFGEFEFFNPQMRKDMRQHDITISEIAEHLGISQRSMSNYISGHTDMPNQYTAKVRVYIYKRKLNWHKKTDYHKID